MSTPFEKILTVNDGVVTTGTTGTTVPAVVPAVVPDGVGFEQMYTEAKAEADRLQSLLTAARIEGKPTHAPGSDKKPILTAEQIKRQLGPLQMLNMPRDAKCRAAGVDPASISDSALRILFGRGSDGVAAKDLSRSNMYQYRCLRELALLLNIYGA